MDTLLRPILGFMRALAPLLAVLALALPALAAAAGRQPAGALSVEGGKGIVIVRGNGGLIGRVAKGTIEVVDLTPLDPWRPTVNGVTHPRNWTLKGGNVSFRILGGGYKVTVKGEGISLSARGSGTATLLGIPGLNGITGLYAADLNADCQGSPDQCTPIPPIWTKVPFPTPSEPTP
jgi:hypothetical protein